VHDRDLLLTLASSSKYLEGLGVDPHETTIWLNVSILLNLGSREVSGLLSARGIRDPAYHDHPSVTLLCLFEQTAKGSGGPDSDKTPKLSSELTNLFQNLSHHNWTSPADWPGPNPSSSVRPTQATTGQKH
jgi:hypothetical protein